MRTGADAHRIAKGQCERQVVGAHRYHRTSPFQPEAAHRGSGGSVSGDVDAHRARATQADLVIHRHDGAQQPAIELAEEHVRGRRHLHPEASAMLDHQLLAEDDLGAVAGELGVDARDVLGKSPELAPRCAGESRRDRQVDDVPAGVFHAARASRASAPRRGSCPSAAPAPARPARCTGPTEVSRYSSAMSCAIALPPTGRGSKHSLAMTARAIGEIHSIDAGERGAVGVADGQLDRSDREALDDGARNAGRVGHLRTGGLNDGMTG